MNLEPDFKLDLTKEQQDQLLEMSKWTFEDNKLITVSGISYGNINIMEKTEYSTSHRYCTYIIMLLFHIPLKLGMDVVVIDPENPGMLFEQIYEKYRIYNNIQETSKKKSRYPSSVDRYDSEENYSLDGCLC